MHDQSVREVAWRGATKDEAEKEIRRFEELNKDLPSQGLFLT